MVTAPTPQRPTRSRVNGETPKKPEARMVGFASLTPQSERLKSILAMLASQDEAQDGFAYWEPMVGLLEVRGLREFVDVPGNLVNAGQGVHEGQGFLGPGQRSLVNLVAAAQPLVFRVRVKPLPLDARDVEDVQQADEVFEVLAFQDFAALAFQGLRDAFLHAQLVGGDEVVLVVAELVERVHQSLDGAAELQVSQEADFEAIESAEPFLNRVQVQEVLRGVLVRSVAGEASVPVINAGDGNAGFAGRNPGVAG